MARGKQWGTLQDESLVKAWIAITGDILTGTNQDHTQFWHRILDGYIKLTKGDKSRSIRGLKGRWTTLSRNVHGFMCAYAKADAAAGSGDSDEDIHKAALAIYQIDHPKQLSFKDVSCWQLLKDNIKFKDINWSAGATGRGNVSSNEETDETEAELPSDPVGESSRQHQEERPIGHKRAKKEVNDSKWRSKICEFMAINAEVQRERKSFLQMLTGAYILSLSGDTDKDQEETRAFFRNARRTIFESQVEFAPVGNFGNAGVNPTGSERTTMPQSASSGAPPSSPFSASVPQHVYHGPPPTSLHFPSPTPSIQGFEQQMPSPSFPFQQHGPSVLASFLASGAGSSF